MSNDRKTLYQEYQDRFRGMSDEELIDAFNREVGNSGWTGARASYLAALHREFGRREYDYSAIGDARSLSFNKKVRLLGRKIVVKPQA